MSPASWLGRHGLALALGVLATIVVADMVLGPELSISASYAVAAVFAAVVSTVRRTALVALAAFAMSALSGVWNQTMGSTEWATRLTLTAALGALAVVVAHVRIRRERDLRHMTVVAETAQRAVLRAMPTEVGSVGFAARYVSATQEALVGGDLYEVAASPYGVRVIVGDVRGKGLEAVQLAATVLGAFRGAAFVQPDLTAIAADLDRVVSSVAGEEDFVTAVLAEFHDDSTVTLVNCGHHPPLMVTGRTTADIVNTGEPALPLGLGPTPSGITSAWPSGARMLIYTDGLVEARDRSGVFFPLVSSAGLLGEGSLEEALDRLVRRLVEYSGADVKDDLALVLAEQRAVAEA